MVIVKVREEVEYYVLNSIDTEEAFTFDENSRVTRIDIPEYIVPLKSEYVFIYIGELRAHPNEDYVLDENGVSFRHPMNATEQIIVKIYTEHTVAKEPIKS